MPETSSSIHFYISKKYFFAFQLLLTVNHMVNKNIQYLSCQLSFLILECRTNMIESTMNERRKNFRVT